MTEGRAALIRALQRISAKEVAIRCRVSPSRVSKWVGGVATPSEEAKRTLESNLGIPCDSWARYAVTVRR